MIEVRWHGRGGQGAVTSVELLAVSAISAGKYAQGFPSFGPERRGAPVAAFTRIDDKKINVRSGIYEPDVVLVLDKSNRTQKYSAADYASHAGIPTLIDDRHAIAHNKIMILDGDVVITGSFNFIKAAEEKNAENLLIIRNRDLAKIYIENWEKHKDHSEKYERKMNLYDTPDDEPNN